MCQIISSGNSKISFRLSLHLDFILIRHQQLTWECTAGKGTYIAFVSLHEKKDIVYDMSPFLGSKRFSHRTCPYLFFEKDEVVLAINMVCMLVTLKALNVVEMLKYVKSLWISADLQFQMAPVIDFFKKKYDERHQGGIIVMNGTVHLMVLTALMQRWITRVNPFQDAT